MSVNLNEAQKPSHDGNPHDHTTSKDTVSSPPLLGPYRVLDLTDEKGSFCGLLMATLGADMIKVEKPGGDDARDIGPFYHDIPDPERSLSWFALNRDKRGITLDVESPQGQNIFRELVKSADFVIESFPPGYMENLGIGYSNLSQVNPRIIVMSITPFGQTGEYKDYKGSDIVCAAMGGLVYMLGDEDRPPVRISVEQSYYQAGVQATAAMLMAHHYRENTGEGQWIDVSIQECMLWTTSRPSVEWYTNGRIFRREGSHQKRMGRAFRMLFPCKDGFVACRIGSGLMAGRMHKKLIRVMNDEGLAEEFRDVDWESLDIYQIPQELIDGCEEAMITYFMRHTKDELHNEALKHGFVLCPVGTMKDMSEYPQLASRDYWVEIRHPELDAKVTYPGSFFKSNETSGIIRNPAPLPGEHNEQIYTTEMGINQAELRALREQGII
ncbi:CaiB/BaiF CoA transferase family protein [Chloroflexota bacterium]